MKVMNIVHLIIISMGLFGQSVSFAGETPEMGMAVAMGGEQERLVAATLVMKNATEIMDITRELLLAEGATQADDKKNVEIIIKQVITFVDAAQILKKMMEENIEEVTEESYLDTFIAGAKKLGAAIVAPFRAGYGYTEKEKENAPLIIEGLMDQQVRITEKYNALSFRLKIHLKKRYEAIIAQFNEAIYQQQLITGEVMSTQKKLLVGAAAAAGTAAGLALANTYLAGTPEEQPKQPSAQQPQQQEIIKSEIQQPTGSIIERQPVATPQPIETEQVKIEAVPELVATEESTAAPVMQQPVEFTEQPEITRSTTETVVPEEFTETAVTTPEEQSIAPEAQLEAIKQTIEPAVEEVVPKKEAIKVNPYDREYLLQLNDANNRLAKAKEAYETYQQKADWGSYLFGTTESRALQAELEAAKAAKDALLYSREIKDVQEKEKRAKLAKEEAEKERIAREAKEAEKREIERLEAIKKAEQERIKKETEKKEIERLEAERLFKKENEEWEALMVQQRYLEDVAAQKPMSEAEYEQLKTTALSELAEAQKAYDENPDSKEKRVRLEKAQVIADEFKKVEEKKQAEKKAKEDAARLAEEAKLAEEARIIEEEAKKRAVQEQEAARIKAEEDRLEQERIEKETKIKELDTLIDREKRFRKEIEEQRGHAEYIGDEKSEKYWANDISQIDNSLDNLEQQKADLQENLEAIKTE